jgi:DNA repair protein RadC
MEKVGAWLEENHPRGGDKPSFKDNNFESKVTEPRKCQFLNMNLRIVD